MAIPNDKNVATLEDAFRDARSMAKVNVVVPPAHPISWIEANFIDPITNAHMRLKPHQRRILRRALMTDNDGHSRYSLVIWSEPKKSGKTTVAAAVAAYVANCIEAPNEVSCVANDQEQSAGRIYANILPTLKHLDWILPQTMRSERESPTAYGPNGTVIKAITTRYEKEAGANQGLTLWSELWAYKGERLTRLWEEMTPPPTRKFSMRWVETYAGFIGENKLLQSLYMRVFKDFDENDMQDRVIKLWHDLPVYEVDERMLVYWSHIPMMPWQTPAYYADQRKTMRQSSFKRLHKNYWVSTTDKFITEDMWRRSCRSEKPAPTRSVFALDGSKNGALTVLVGCIKEDGALRTTYAQDWSAENGIWTPSGKEVDYAKVQAEIVRLHRAGLIIPPLWYDPYQMAKMAQDLRKVGVPCKEFTQGADRLKSDTFLFEVYRDGVIINYPHPTLELHVTGASVVEDKDGKLRIIKPGERIRTEELGESRDEDKADEVESVVDVYVDYAVAQSMAAYKAYHKISGGWSAGSKLGEGKDVQGQTS